MLEVKRTLRQLTLQGGYRKGGYDRRAMIVVLSPHTLFEVTLVGTILFKILIMTMRMMVMITIIMTTIILRMMIVTTVITISE